MTDEEQETKRQQEAAESARKRFIAAVDSLLRGDMSPEAHKEDVMWKAIELRKWMD